MSDDQHHGMNERMQILAHDIRNALSSMYTYAQILEASPAGLDSAQQKQIGAALAESVREIEKMLADTVDMKTVEAE